MNKVSVSELEAGPKLDLMVAHLIMNWYLKDVLVATLDEVTEYADMGGSLVNSELLGKQVYSSDKRVDEWRPSNDHNDAFDVVKRMANFGVAMELTHYGGDDDEAYCCSFSKEAPRMAGLVEWGGEGWANTAPLAICRAALEAISSKVRREKGAKRLV